MNPDIRDVEEESRHHGSHGVDHSFPTTWEGVWPRDDTEFRQRDARIVEYANALPMGYGYRLRDIMPGVSLGVLANAIDDDEGHYIGASAFALQGTFVKFYSERSEVRSIAMHMTNYSLSDIETLYTAPGSLSNLVHDGPPAWAQGNSGGAVGMVMRDSGIFLMRKNGVMMSVLSTARTFYTGGFERFFLFDAVLELKFANGSFHFYIPGGISRFRKRLPNCVAQCLEWSLSRDAETEEEKEAVRQRCVALCDAFEEERVPREPAETFRARLRRYRRNTREGFSNVLLAEWVRFLAQRDIHFMVFRYHGPEKGFKVMRACRGLEFAGVREVQKVQCFQIGYDGEFVDVEADVLEDRCLLVHMGAIWPPQASYRLGVREGREDLCLRATFGTLPQYIGKHVRDVMEEAKEELDLAQTTRTSLSVRRIGELVSCQNARYLTAREGYVPHWSGEELGEAEENNPYERGISSRRNGAAAAAAVRQQKARAFRIGLGIYDMETVGNLRGCQDVVWEPVAKPPPAQEIPAFLRDAMTIPETQIPYTVQWMILTPEDLDWSALDPAPENVRIERGDFQLGKCVSDFLHAAYAQARHSKLRRVYWYAHNGSGFDSYMILRYNTEFPVSRVLITPRGVLSMTVDVQVGEGGPKIPFIFRDTKLFFNAGLGELCKVFKVPAEYAKTDFPIVRIHARNFASPAVVEASEEYMRNDVLALAYIVKGINEVIADAILPFATTSVEAAGADPCPSHIHRYVTLMSLVTKIQSHLFQEKVRAPPPVAVDLGALRKFVDAANMGGRVLPFWRGYRSARASAVLASVLATGLGPNPARAAGLYAEMRAARQFGVVLDVTSEYPYVMAAYPMPTGQIKAVGDPASQFAWVKLELSCRECAIRARLCPQHENGLADLGFTIFLVTRLRHENPVVGVTFLGCGRKKKKGGLAYHFGDVEEGLGASAGAPLYPEVEAFTQYDLYWLDRSGWTFEIVGAFRFECSYVFSEAIRPMFEERKAAKRKEAAEGLPKSTSTMWKNLYNGMYGINARRDIARQYVVYDDADLVSGAAAARLDPNERPVAGHYYGLANGQTCVEIEKEAMSCELYAEQSPNQIGAAVTACARHHMNLLMATLHPSESYGYTDTDSLFVTGEALAKIEAERPWLLDARAEADMGTYKNDHEAPGEMVFASFLLGKKVKLHATIDEKGQVRLHDTFKGFMPSVWSAEGVWKTPEEVQCESVVALSEIFATGRLVTPVAQTEFRRSVGDGVTIDRESPFSAEEEAFFGWSEGSVVRRLGNGDEIEIIVPRGASFDPHVGDGSGEVAAWRIDPGQPLRKYVQKRSDYYASGPEEQESRFMHLWGRLLERLRDEAREAARAQAERDAGWDDIFSRAPALTPADYEWATNSE